ncbi:MAG: hypothetical protein M0Z90_09285 [Desulfobacteraceae bacterium]|nr:hypothetical protein [Desulfobacteraceae bacterium]
MDKLIKGNYELENEVEIKSPAHDDDMNNFENKAMEKLGGSIAFVMKGNKLLWDDEDDDK